MDMTGSAHLYDVINHEIHTLYDTKPATLNYSMDIVRTKANEVNITTILSTILLSTKQRHRLYSH
jgi:hypothetical protein